ncbi:MAG: histidine kinase [Oceanospirillum sp.]|nr:histidine kinase [Oceanospirillum sp.]
MLSDISLNLKTRMVIILGSFALLITLSIGAVALNIMSDTLEQQMGQQALSTARAVAKLPQIRQGLMDNDSRQIQPLVEEIRASVGARFIVVGDSQGIRYAHPVPNRIGKKMVGGDNARALQYGEEYVSKAKGSLGLSIRGKVPVYAVSQGEGSHNYGSVRPSEPEIIGVVSVGFMLTQVEATIASYQRELWWLAGIALAISLMLAVMISSYFKQAIFGFEPEQIARLFQERNATLQSVREGIIAINAEGQITTFNKTALDIFQLDPERSLNGRNIQELLPDSQLLKVMHSAEAVLDKEDIIGGQRVVVNRIPLIQQGQVIGAVSSFRLKDELDQLMDQLNRMQIYADTLRSQAHEYSNKLHTIAGLIQVGAYDQAIDLIGQETKDHQTLLHLLLEAVPDPMLSGCILGKYNRAREMGMMLVVDPDSQMQDLPEEIPRELLVTILANLLDNAMDANLHSQGKMIRLSMTDLGNDLIFEVEDEGLGVDEALSQTLLQKGVSSKSGEQHGYGLYLVQRALERLGGQIVFEALDADLETQGEGFEQTDSKGPQGTRVEVYIPKQMPALSG